MDSIRGWCAANLILTKLKSSTLHEKVIQLIVFTNYVITHTDSIKDLRVLFGTTFIFSITQNIGTRTYIWEPNETYLCTRELENRANVGYVTAHPFTVPPWWTRLHLAVRYRGGDTSHDKTCCNFGAWRLYLKSNGFLLRHRAARFIPCAVCTKMVKIRVPSLHM